MARHQAKKHLTSQPDEPFKWETIAADEKEAAEELLTRHVGIPEQFTGSLKQLYCRTGYNLAVDPSGRVYGTTEPFSKNAVLQLTSDEIGEVRIKGQEADMYVAMDNEGKLRGQSASGEETVFYERMDSEGWNSYLSKKYSWLLAIKKSGRPKRGSRTAPGQRATQFLPRPPHRPSS